MNVDLTSVQYNMVELFEQAQKLGLDMEDLTQEGFDEEGLRCAELNGACKHFDKHSSAVEIFKLNSEFAQNMTHKMIK